MWPFSSKHIVDTVKPTIERSSDLTFDDFQRANHLRSFDIHSVANGWSPMKWGCALAGELGELCNFLKKWERDGASEALHLEIQKEIGDVYGYLDLIASRFGIRTGEAIRQKWNTISVRLSVHNKHWLGSNNSEIFDDQTLTSSDVLGRFVPVTNSVPTSYSYMLPSFSSEKLSLPVRKTDNE